MSSEAPNTAPIPPAIALATNPLPPVERVGEQGGVGTQDAPAVEAIAPDSNATSNGIPNIPDGWPTWAPAPPTDIPPTPWEAEGRRPRPDELLPQPDTPARSPADYAIPDGLLGDLSDPVALVNGRGLQSLLWSAGLPAHEGASLLQAIKDASRNADPDMSDEAFDLRAKETERVLKRQLGEPEYTRRRDALTALLTEMDKKSNGELSDLLGDNAVVLTDPMVMMKLLAHAGRADKRRRG